MDKSRAVIRGTERKDITGAKVIGRSNASQRIRVTVEVRRNKQPPPPGSLKRALRRQELAAEYGAAAADLAMVREFAASHRLHVVEASRAKRTVVLAGTVGDFSEAFGVELNDVEVGPRV